MPDTEPEHLLLVEGEDDAHVVRQLCNRYQSIPRFSIRETGGIERLLDAIGPALIPRERKALGILVDADDNPEGRWDDLRSRFDEEGISIPAHPGPNGMIMDAHIEIGNSPRTGIWVMPNNDSSGEIENFVADMIPMGDPVWPLSQGYVDGIPTEHRRFRPGKLLRAKVYAWLATREIPGRMGAAIGAGELNVGAETARRFVGWLRELFK